MALPTQKRTKSSRKKRALHFKLKGTKYISCPKCGRPILPHHACSFCGTYAGKEILDIKIKRGKKKKEEEKERKEQEKSKEKKTKEKKTWK